MLLEHEPCSSLMHVNFYQRTEVIQRATQYFYFSNFIFLIFICCTLITLICFEMP